MGVGADMGEEPSQEKTQLKLIALLLTLLDGLPKILWQMDFVAGLWFKSPIVSVLLSH